MITVAQATYLLGLPKHVIENENYLDTYIYSPSLPIKDRIFMASKNDDVYSFFLDIWQSSKAQIKMSLHFQEDDSSIGLLRVDFNGRHKNPETINDNVPAIFKPYAGMWIEESHIHYFVEGYKTLDWAIPLSMDNTFSIKTFTTPTQIGTIIQTFGQRINLQTALKINIQQKTF